LFLIAILSWASISQAFAQCRVVRWSPIINYWGEPIGSVSSRCFEAFDPSDYWMLFPPEYGIQYSKYWIRGRVLGFGGPGKQGWVLASSIDCRWRSCRTFG
jgi:hypothetical protein